MFRVVHTALLFVCIAAPALAQTPPAGPDNPRRFQPPPDHWMTIDSLSQALSLTQNQRTKMLPSYTALNAVVKDAAARRQGIRQRMQGSFVPGQEPTPAWVAAIRNALSPDQQAKFDALAKPRLARPPRQ